MGKIQPIFLAQKNDFESMNFDMFEEVVHNFGKSDDDMIKCKMLIFTRSIHGFMFNLMKKFWTDTTPPVERPHMHDLDLFFPTCHGLAEIKTT